MLIRDATEADLPAIVDIYNATIPSRMVTADLTPVSVESWRPWLVQRDAASFPVWMIDCDARAAGWLSFSIYKPRPAYRPTAEVSLYLDEAFRGRGLGRAALQQAIERAPTLGLRNLVGVIYAHNTPSVRLFSSMGFVQWGLLPGVCELDGVERDVLILGRRVS